MLPVYRNNRFMSIGTQQPGFHMSLFKKSAFQNVSKIIAMFLFKPFKTNVPPI